MIEKILSHGTTHHFFDTNLESQPWTEVLCEYTNTVGAHEVLHFVRLQLFSLKGFPHYISSTTLVFLMDQLNVTSARGSGLSVGVPCSVHLRESPVWSR